MTHNQNKMEVQQQIQARLRSAQRDAALAVSYEDPSRPEAQLATEYVQQEVAELRRLLYTLAQTKNKDLS